MKTMLGRLMVWHRLLALPSCFFFGVWFVSGIVMMYARMPELTESQRLDRLPTLDLRHAKPLTLALGQLPERITLGMLNGRPVYRILGSGGSWSCVYADTGLPVGEVSAAAAIEAAASFSGLSPRDLQAAGEIHTVDQWTVYPASRPYLPFHLIRADDPQHSIYYVSAATGAVYLATTRRSRFLAWCGVIPHWWYITALRSHNSLWHWVMIAASAWGLLMCVFGIAAGALRYSPSRRYRFPGPRYSSVPHVGTKRWHYLLGYIFGAVTFTWILSGLFSMNPGSWSPGPEASLDEVHAFAGAPLRVQAFRTAPLEAWTILRQCVPVKELELIMFQGAPYYLARHSVSEVRLLPAAAPEPSCISQMPVDSLVSASRQPVGGAAVLSADLLTGYDSYYYDRNSRKPLPVLRVRLNDPRQTWLYVNPKTALIVARYTARSRWERWLYNGLHSLDFPFLVYRRPLWDIVVVVLSAGGFTLSVSGIVLALRYMQKRARKRLQALQRA